MQQLDIKSFDSTPIHCYLWDDVESPKGVVQISHGMCEYAGSITKWRRCSMSTAI